MLRPFYAMNPVEAAQFNEATADWPDRLEPREVAAGQYAGKHVLPERAKAAFPQLALLFIGLPLVAIDPEEAWPPSEEELRARMEEQS